MCLVMNLMSTLGQRAASWERSLSVMFSGGSASDWQRCDVKVCQLRLPGTEEDRDPAHLSASWLWTHTEVSVPMHFPLESSSEPEMRSEDFIPERREKGFLSKQEVIEIGLWICEIFLGGRLEWKVDQQLNIAMLRAWDRRRDRGQRSTVKGPLVLTEGEQRISICLLHHRPF